MEPDSGFPKVGIDLWSMQFWRLQALEVTVLEFLILTLSHHYWDIYTRNMLAFKAFPGVSLTSYDNASLQAVS